MPFSYYRRLSAAKKRIYDKSAAIPEIRLPPGAVELLHPAVARLDEALTEDERHRVHMASQEIADTMFLSLRVPPVRIAVLAVRPSKSWGELHGLYDPTKRGVAPTISLWMRTAQRQQVVAFRTFFRTLLHELCHHLDYHLLRLPDSFHTEGFYQRESSLFRQLVPQVEKPRRARRIEAHSRPGGANDPEGA